jgi:hypothetical protein
MSHHHSTMFVHSFSAQDRNTTKPIYPDLSSNLFKNDFNERHNYTNASTSLFEDVQLDNHNEQYFSPPDQHNYPIQPNNSTPINSPQKHDSHQAQKRHNFNEKISEEDPQQNLSPGVILLLDANEHLAVSSFIQSISNLIFFF